METQIKQRIAGIVVLVILIIAVLSLLFFGAKQDHKENLAPGVNGIEQQIMPEGQGEVPMPSQEPPIAATPNDVVLPGKEPVKTEAIPDKFGQLENAKKSVGPEVVAPAVASESAVTPEVAAAPNAVANVPAEPVVAPALPAVNSVAAEANVPEATKEEAKPIKIKAPKKAHAVVWQGKWVVRVGTFSEPPNVVKLVQKLKSKGYHTYTRLLVTSTKGVLTQVFVGPTTKDGARKINKELLRKFKIKGVVTSR